MSYLINLHKCGLNRMNGGTINIHNAHCYTVFIRLLGLKA